MFAEIATVRCSQHHMPHSLFASHKEAAVAATATATMPPEQQKQKQQQQQQQQHWSQWLATYTSQANLANACNPLHLHSYIGRAVAAASATASATFPTYNLEAFSSQAQTSGQLVSTNPLLHRSGSWGLMCSVLA